MIRAGGVTSVVAPVGGWRCLGAGGGLVIRGQGGLEHLETLIDIGSGGSTAELGVGWSSGMCDVDTGGRIDISNIYGFQKYLLWFSPAAGIKIPKKNL